MRGRDALVGVGVGVLLAAAIWPVMAKEPAAEKEAADLVAQALDAELRGNSEQRQLLLQQAVKVAPKYAPARWQLGQVSHQGKWTPVDAVVRETQGSEIYAQYRELRKANAGSGLGELRLARWCHKNKLLEEEQLHWSAVLRFDADNVEAAKALGLQKYQGRWLAPQQIEAFKQAQKQFEADREYWKPRLTRWADAVEKHSAEEREKSLANLRAIDDLAAIPWLEAIVSKRTEDLGREVIEIVAKRNEQAAIASLVRHALLSQFDDVRHAAIEKLKDRPLEAFVGPLVEGLTSPPDVEVDRAAQAAPVNRPSMLRLSVSARVETMTEVREIDSTFRGLSFSGQFGPETFLGLAERWALVGQLRNMEVINIRICELLEAVTDQRFGRDEKKWWQWWADYNQRLIADGEKPIRKNEREDFAVTAPFLARSVEGLPAAGIQANTGQPRRDRSGLLQTPREVMKGEPGAFLGILYNSFGQPYTCWLSYRQISCFVAGTVVHTKAGTIPIEDVKVGDVVLSQNAETAELAYKPVLQTTLRPPSKIAALTIDGEPIGCTLGHPFWVVGEGWKMAKDLQQGDRVHSLQGARLIESVRQADEEPAYNLVVADFGSYFVGEQAVLVHDNSPVQPTNCVVPGLVRAAALPSARR